MYFSSGIGSGSPPRIGSGSGPRSGIGSGSGPRSGESVVGVDVSSGSGSGSGSSSGSKVVFYVAVRGSVCGMIREKRVIEDDENKNELEDLNNDINENNSINNDDESSINNGSGNDNEGNNNGNNKNNGDGNNNRNDGNNKNEGNNNENSNIDNNDDDLHSLLSAMQSSTFTFTDFSSLGTDEKNEKKHFEELKLQHNWVDREIEINSYEDRLYENSLNLFFKILEQDEINEKEQEKKLKNEENNVSGGEEKINQKRNSITNKSIVSTTNITNVPDLNLKNNNNKNEIEKKNENLNMAVSPSSRFQNLTQGPVQGLSIMRVNGPRLEPLHCVFSLHQKEVEKNGPSQKGKNKN